MATLASTLVGTFTASMGLYDRVSDRRQQHKQRKRDVHQDGEIKTLKDEFEKTRKEADERQKEIDRLKNGGGNGGGRDDYGGGQQMARRGGDDVGYNLERDAMMVQRMYDNGFGRYGSRFAQGDGAYYVTPVPELQTDSQNSYRREPAPSTDYITPTDSHQRSPRRPQQRPSIDPRRPSQADRSLKCRT
jgi:hypothetical protein